MGKLPTLIRSLSPGLGMLVGSTSMTGVAVGTGVGVGGFGADGTVASGVAVATAVGLACGIGVDARQAVTSQISKKTDRVYLTFVIIVLLVSCTGSQP